MRYDYYLITSELLVQTDTFIIPVVCPSGGSLAAKKTHKRQTAVAWRVKGQWEEGRAIQEKHF